MWQVPVTICLLFYLHFYHLKTSVGVCGHHVQCQIPIDSRPTLLQHSRLHRLPIQEGCKGFHYVGKILNEIAVLANKTKEWSYLFSILWVSSV